MATMTIERVASGLKRGIPVAVKDVLLQRVLLVTDAAIQREMPERSGRLKRGQRTQVLSAGEKGRIYNTERYAIFVHTGTKPHAIVAKNAQVLRFQVGGKTVFARRVQHPGTKPNRFYDRGFSQAQSAIDAVLRFSGAEILKELVA